ncbi:MAG: peptidoglycan editing factor PgeF [Coriobacteriia bacterium]|nr:peptidoglycan editing factor PgeF [Coriobacteriia bacterium]
MTRLVRQETNGVSVHSDPILLARHGIVVAFSERSGGSSAPPYDSLNLAAHVGDEPSRVDENRDRLLAAVDLADSRKRLVTARQVHGDHVAVVGAEDAGKGAFASGGRDPIVSADAMLTTEVGLPLMLLYADCVPVVIVAADGSRGVAVAHAGWRGVLAGVPGKAVRALALETAQAPEDLYAYIGPHIGPCCYEVDEERVSQFRNTFATITAVGNGLDLAAAVREDLARAGVSRERTAAVGICTADHTERFFSYRASNVTGRHAALGAIAKGD